MILKRKHFSIRSNMQEVAEDVVFDDLGPKNGKESLKNKISRISGNIKRRVVHEYKTGGKGKKAAMIAVPTVIAGTGIGIAAKKGVKSYREKEKEYKRKEYIKDGAIYTK